MLDFHLGIGLGHAVSLPALAGLGLLVGIVAGMFGVGGGSLLTPLLLHVFKIPAAIAVGSGLSQKCGSSVVSFAKYRHLKRGDPRIDLLMMGGSLMGVDVGSRFLAYLSGRPDVLIAGHPLPLAIFVLDCLFILVLGCASVGMLVEARLAFRNPVSRGDKTIPGFLVTKVRIPPFVDLPEVQLYRVSVPLLAAIGLVLGAAEGVMGTGGGMLLMPVLLYGFGLSARNAAGTGNLLVLATVSLGAIEQALRGFVSLRLSMAILVGSSVGAQIGALITHRLSNRVLRLIFAVVLALTVVFICSDLLATILAPLHSAQ
ncbi:MAG: sulfite exporter TauE/SafE family protein [Armatimonadetes bacterium]|nr:sulfite exporter TauE/SafE family protein [Armatimonadota bacterium]